MDTGPLWTTAAAALENGERATLVAVVEHHGSVPGTTGAMMVVTPRTIAGTVGGGLVEHQLIEKARQEQEAQLLPFSHDGDSTDSVCSGSQLFALLPLTSRDGEAIATLEAILEKDSTGSVTVGNEGLEAAAGRPPAREFLRTMDGWRFTTPVGRLDTLTIAGGGHVSLALSRVMSTLPFRIVVLDDRPDLPTMTGNTWAHETRRIAWDEVADHVDQGPNSWMVIMTQGHRHDARVLRRTLGLDLRYLGMMGSAAKVREVFSALESEGFSREDLRRTYTPIGVPIGSHTPEEIAISIAAEIVKVRNSA